MWDQQVKKMLEAMGFTELCVNRGIFVYHVMHISQDGKVKEMEFIAVLGVHVDDGCLFGDTKHPKYKSIRKTLDEEFDIKEWKQLKDKTDVDYLGMQWTQFQDATIEVNMKQYVEGLQVHQISTEKPEKEILLEELKIVYKSLHAKLRWPVSHVIPECAYRVSALSQKSRDHLT